MSGAELIFMKPNPKIITTLILLLAIAGCALQQKMETPQLSPKANNNMKLTSPDFENNQMIPAKFTCDGMDINPPLEISEVPSSAQSLVLTVDDPDAPMGTWDHWLVWNIDPSAVLIEENSVPKKAVQGKNSFGKQPYGGPCPPSGTHRYFFKLYALDTQLTLAPSSDKSDLTSAMSGHVLGQAEIVGLYKR